ncbi:MAG: hypothetical protein AB4352_30080 [Hormoscilla sp.]
MTYNWETSLPYSLQNPADKSKIKDVTMQWSRIIAWSWTDLLAFKDDPSKAKQELALKKFFNATFQQQGLNTIAYESYDDENAKETANLLSGYIQSMLLGNNDDVPYLKDNGIEVTLAEVLKKLSDEDFVFTKDPEFAKMFTCRVIPEFVGSFIETGYRQYVAEIAYPPRPALNEYTVTEPQLLNWAQNIDTGGNYLPPSLYIPFGAS